jgi:YggT family protein
MPRRSVAASSPCSSEPPGETAAPRAGGRASADPRTARGPAGVNAIVYIVDTLASLALFVALLRLLLQWARADFRNPISQAVVRMTNPLVMPLRRILPPVGRVDTASVVTVVIVALAEVAIVFAVHGFGMPPVLIWVREAAIEILRTALWTYFYAILLYAVLSFIAPGDYSPVQSLLTSLCEPVLRPFRRLIKPIGGLDLSPLWACIVIQALLILLPA